MAVVNRPKTSKQKHRIAAKRSKLRNNAKEKHSASKRGLLKHQGGKRKQRVDKRSLTEISTRTAEQLVSDVKAGKVVATGDPMDARTLVDLLKMTGAQGRPKLAADTAVIPSNKAFAKVNAELDAEEEAMNNNVQKKNANQYARRGPSHAFWNRMGVHPMLMRALKEMGFTHPTPIQAETLPSLLSESTNDKNRDHRREDFRKDFVVSAETGSGKTLVFALPILNRILHRRVALDAAIEASVKESRRTIGAKVPRDGDEDEEADEVPEKAEDEQEEEEEEVAPSDVDDEEAEEEEDGGAEDEEDFDEEAEEDIEEVDPLSDAVVGAIKVLDSIIITPTRELAIQIADTMKKLTAFTERKVYVACIVGGMNPSRQQRILNRKPDVLICTPGRLWDLVKKNEGAFLGHSVSRRLECVVLDEADRLVESNRFEELKNVLERVRCATLPQGLAEQLDNSGGEALTEGAWDPVKKEFVPLAKVVKRRKDEPIPMPTPAEPEPSHRTTFVVTSATLSLQVNFQNKNIREKKILRTKNASTMHLVMKDLGLVEKHTRIFDQAPDANVVSRLQETYLRCPENSKELYLYYFVRQYAKSGRTIVFVNAISMLRRLVKVLEIMRVPVVGIHASMQQRQRLKVIDKFRSGEKSVLIATDVAARGLDVEGVKYVVHYQLARSTDAYIHRCGRTARCGGEGFSCVFVNPDEFHPYQQLMRSMGRSAKIEVFSLDQSIVRKLRGHLMVALDIDKLARSGRKKHAEQGWVNRMAKDADLDADDMIDDSIEQEAKEKAKAAKTLQRRLDAMLREDTGGAQGAYLASPRALGAAQAVADVHDRAKRQIRMHRAEDR